MQVWFHGPWHVKWSIADLNEGAIEDLTKGWKKLHRLSDCELNNTDASDPGSQPVWALGVWCTEAASFCHPSHQNLSSVHLLILL